jgi:hypothetical protein
MQTATQTETPVSNVNLTGLPVAGAAAPELNLVPGPTAEAVAAAKAKQAEAEAAAAKAAQEVKDKAIARFEAAPFSLEVETVGSKAWSRKISKTGAVRVALASKKELGVISGGLTGADLDSFTRMEKDKMKNKQTELAVKLQADNGWTGGGYVLNAKGNKIVIEYTKCAKQTVGIAEPTEEQALAKLNLTPEILKAALAMAAAAAKQAEELALQAAKQAEADKRAEDELMAEQAAMEAGAHTPTE